MDNPLALCTALLALNAGLGGIAIPTDDPNLLEAVAAQVAGYLSVVENQPRTVTRLPLNADLPALNGYVDGFTRVRQAGLLERASGGVLRIPYPDLLRQDIAAPLHTALKHSGIRLVLGLAPDNRWPGLIELCGLMPLDAAVAEWYEAEQVAGAARLLASVTIEDQQIQALAAATLELGVVGWRADTLATRAAKAHAALLSRTQVIDEDLIAAIALVLAPRATRQPTSNSQPPPQPEPPEGDSGDPGKNGEDEQERGEAEDVAERLIAATQASLPEGALALSPPGRRARKPAPVTSGRRRGAARQERVRALRGAPGRAVAAQRRPAGALLDTIATLSAALPLQRLRRLQQVEDEARILLRPGDLHWRKREAQPGVLFLLAVDSSGSMARNRLAQAKGATLALLERAYRYRDRVALLAFRGQEATLLLPPTRSTARAARLVQAMPAGGGTPLAAALEKALQLHAQAARQGVERLVLVLLTDGRGNVPLTPGREAGEEIEELAGAWARLVDGGEVAVLLVDTRVKFLGAGEAAGLAQLMHARYLYLPSASGAAIGEAAQQVAASRGWRL